VKVEIRELRDGDAEALLANLRPADRDEIEALLGPGAEARTLAESIERSVLLWVAVAGDEIAAIFGVVPINMLGGQGAPWLLGTPLIDRHGGAFIKLNRIYIARMLALFPTLLNIVDARNVKSIAWLKHMGFKVYPPQTLGKAGLPFHPFVMGPLHV
jgi:hypothetical protein